MGHFAEIENGIVKRVLAISDGEALSLTERYGGEWLKTSYNTHGGVHSLGGEPLRKNYAGVGYRYDAERDAFIAPQPFPSWELDEETCNWGAPVSQPDDAEGKHYGWNEETLSWEELINEQ